MTSASGVEVGAQLGELYLKGARVLPQVAAEIASAESTISGISMLSALMRDWSLGVGSQGCYAEFDGARTAISDRLEELNNELVTIGHNIVKTSQDLANVDNQTAQAFKKAGGQL